MKQVVQEVRSGRTTVRQLPAPVATDGQVIVDTRSSLVSAGTERYVVELARKSLLGKARERPDQVKRVLEKLVQEGVLPTVSQVFAKLDEPMPLGYSSAGVVLECGRGVEGVAPGDRVATTGPHAGVVSVGHRLCARIPDGVTFEQAAYTSVAAIALEGVRLADAGIGSRVLVIGLGLVGQIAVALLKAQGCRVFGTDVDERRLEEGRAIGADMCTAGSPRDAVREFSGGAGVDAVLITAATSSNEPIEFAADCARIRGRVVLVGVAGLELPRRPFFEKELSFTVSSSLGPGRYDASYHERGHDYPVGYVRWTAQRNMEAVLDLMAAGTLPVEKLTSHRFSIDNAEDAYSLITDGSEPHLGIVIDYPPEPEITARKVALSSTGTGGNGPGISVAGVGNFARLVMLPALQRVAAVKPRGICSARGMRAVERGEKHEFEFATTEYSELLADDETDAIFVLTQHHLHAEMVIDAILAGKHVFVEKPLCIKEEELARIDAVISELGDECPVVMVGYNRRFSPAAEALADHFRAVGPVAIQYRFAAGPVPGDSWIRDEARGGGRLVGELCHAIDLCTAIARSLPVRVFAETIAGEGAAFHEDHTFVTLKHENGSVSNISYQASEARSGVKERVEVFARARSGAVADWGEPNLQPGPGKKRLLPRPKDKGHHAEVEAFIEAVSRGGAWPIPWPELYSTSWAAFAAVRSLRDGLPQNRVDG